MWFGGMVASGEISPTRKAGQGLGGLVFTGVVSRHQAILDVGALAQFILASRMAWFHSLSWLSSLVTGHGIVLGKEVIGYTDQLPLPVTQLYEGPRETLASVSITFLWKAFL